MKLPTEAATGPALTPPAPSVVSTGTDGPEALRERLSRLPVLRVLVDPRFPPLAAGVALVAALCLRIVQLAGKSTTSDWATDFTAYWNAATSVIAGASPYAPYQLAGPFLPVQPGMYLYPPFLAVLVTPLTVLPAPVAGAAWSLLGGAAFVAVGVLLGRLGGVARTPGAVVLFVGSGLAFPPVFIELVVGNVNLWLFALLGVAWWGVRADRSVVTGVAIAAAGLIKVFPFVLVVWLVATGRWRALAWVGLGTAIIVVSTLPLTGLQPWLDYPRILSNASAGAVSVVPTVGDFLAGTLDPPSARLVVVAGGVLIIAASARRWEAPFSYAMAVAVSVLAAPILWNQYLVLMLLPIMLVLPRIRPRWLPLVPYALMWPTGLGAVVALGSWLVPAVIARAARTGRA